MAHHHIHPQIPTSLCKDHGFCLAHDMKKVVEDGGAGSTPRETPRVFTMLGR